MTIFRITPSTSVVTSLMGDHAFEGDSAGADQLIVDSGAFLVTTGLYADAALLGPTGAWSVTVNGSVVSDEYYGLVLESGNAASSTITIGAEGEVSGQTAALSLRSSATVTNHGLIGTSGLTGIDIAGAGQRTIINTGTIETPTAISDFEGLSQDSVINSGLITGHVSLGGGNDMLANSGTMTRGVSLGDGQNSLTNSGRIEGELISVNLGADADVVTNYATINGVVVSGTIIGAIYLGGGNDRFLGGANTEVVYDSNGSDTVTLGGGDDSYLATGNYGADGADTVGGGSGTDTYDASWPSSGPVQVNLDTVAHDLSPFSPGTSLLAAGTVRGSVGWGGTGNDRISGFENVKGGSSADIIHGSAGANILEGNDGADHLFGYGGNDQLSGGASVDKLLGGAGRDIQTGGAGADDFVFTSMSHSGTTAATRDVITDFEHLQDLIVLAHIDAKAGTAANDAFTFIGSNVAFSGHAGELRSYYTATGQQVEGDVNGDGVADFSIALRDAQHTLVLTEADFVL